MLSVIKIDKISSVNFYDLSPKFNTRMHNHSEWEIFYVDSGEVSCILEDQVVVLNAGDVIFHSPNTRHDTVCNGKKSATMFNILFYCDSPAIEYFKEKSFSLPKGALATLKELMEECALTYKLSHYPIVVDEDAPVGGVQMTHLLLEKLLLLLIRNAENYRAPHQKQIGPSDSVCGFCDEICTFMKERIYGKMDLDDLTEQFHFGKSFLCEQFKKHTGTSPINYYIDLKLSEAKRLLREDDLTVSEIAEMLGFESPEYFSRCFKKRTGHSPREFRKMLINDASLLKKQ